MARCYSACVHNRHPPRSLPAVWLISDARNDAWLEDAIDRLPPHSGMIFRHYHLPPREREAHFRKLARQLRRRGHLAVLSGSARCARRWGADGAYGSPTQLGPGPALLRLVTAHDLRELAQANRMRADAVLLSPVFSTRSHVGGATLGPVRFRFIAARSLAPVIALGGMSTSRARALRSPRWAAIDNLAQPRSQAFPIHS
jgi:thiamine-phosphate pyrophosphorylase